MNAPRPRFYREVAIESSSESTILLDGKPAKTPAGRLLQLPTQALAEAVAEEWRAQEPKIRPETMLLTKLANTAIDRVALDRQAVIDQIVSFAKCDLVCYRACEPAELKERQAKAWDPPLEWVRTHPGVDLKTTSGIAFLAQPVQALKALQNVLLGRSDFELAALSNAASVLGSAVLALTLADRKLDAEAAFAAAHVDEIYQRERWGEDQEAAAKARSKREELDKIAAFLRLVKEPGQN